MNPRVYWSHPEATARDDAVLEMMEEEASLFVAAGILRIPAELLDFKFRILKHRGYKIIDPPLMANGGFLEK